MTTRVLLVAGVVALTLAPAAHAGTRSCANVGNTRNLTASGTTCKTAKKVARAYLNGKTHPYGYSCKRHPTDFGLVVSCGQSGKLVKWDVGPRG